MSTHRSVAEILGLLRVARALVTGDCELALTGFSSVGELCVAVIMAKPPLVGDPND